MSPSEYQELVEFLGCQFAVIDRRFVGIETELREFRQEVREFRHEVFGHFDEIYRRLERFEQEYQAVLQALRRIEASMADDRGRREIVERDLAELKRRVATLEARIESLQQRLDR